MKTAGSGIEPETDVSKLAQHTIRETLLSSVYAD
jgi:hypothetical protein